MGNHQWSTSPPIMLFCIIHKVPSKKNSTLRFLLAYYTGSLMSARIRNCSSVELSRSGVLTSYVPDTGILRLTLTFHVAYISRVNFPRNISILGISLDIYLTRRRNHCPRIRERSPRARGWRYLTLIVCRPIKWLLLKVWPMRTLRARNASLSSINIGWFLNMIKRWDIDRYDFDIEITFFVLHWYDVHIISY